MTPPDPEIPESSPPDPGTPESSPPDPGTPESSPPDPGTPESSPPDPATPESSPPDAPLRLFVALELPAAARSALVAFRDAAADPRTWRPVPEESLHLTLAFLGRLPAGDVATISKVLDDTAGSAPRLVLEGALLLPPRRARVLAVSLADLDGTLAELQSRVSAGLAAAGVYAPERRPFRAHATVARLRPRERAPRAVEDTPEPVAFRGEALTLFASHLHPHGPRYEALARVLLS